MVYGTYRTQYAVRTRALFIAQSNAADDDLRMLNSI